MTEVRTQKTWKRWSPWENNYLNSFYGKIPTPQLAEILGRKYREVKARAIREGIPFHDDTVVDATKFAREHKMHQSTSERLIREGKIKAIKRGNTWVVDSEQVITKPTASKWRVKYSKHLKEDPRNGQGLCYKCTSPIRFQETRSLYFCGNDCSNAYRGLFISVRKAMFSRSQVPKKLLTYNAPFQFWLSTEPVGVVTREEPDISKAKSLRRNSFARNLSEVLVGNQGIFLKPEDIHSFLYYKDPSYEEVSPAALRTRIDHLRNAHYPVHNIFGQGYSIGVTNLSLTRTELDLLYTLWLAKGERVETDELKRQIVPTFDSQNRNRGISMMLNSYLYRLKQKISDPNIIEATDTAKNGQILGYRLRL